MAQMALCLHHDCSHCRNFLSINSCDSYQPVSLAGFRTGRTFVELIDGAENSTITLTKGTDSYFRLEISNIDPNDHILPGLAKAWCIDWRTPISTGVHDGIRLHSSYGDKSLKPVNYLLNIKGALMAQDEDLTYTRRFRQLSGRSCTILNST
jgi:hypothetical protein